MIFNKCQWCEEAEEKILPLVSESVREGFKRDIDQERAFLWRVEGDEFTTWLVTRLETMDGGKIRLVLECIAGTHAREIVAELKIKVKKLGVSTMRFETHHSDKVASRLVGCLGFERVASIFEVSL